MPNWVEEVDLLCPHKRELFVGPINGVTHYEHEDKSSCLPLNSFVQTAQRTFAEMGVLEGIGDVLKVDEDGNFVKETPLMRAAYIVSSELRDAYYRKMAKVKEPDLLKRYLQRLIVLMNGAYNEPTLAWELERTFGPVIWSNLSKVTTLQLHQVAQAPAKTYKLPRYKMINVQNARITSDILELEHEVEQKTRKRWS